MRKLKLLLITIFVIGISIVFGGQAYAANTMDLNITNIRPYTNSEYTVITPNANVHTIFKIMKNNGTTYSYEDALYCLRSGLGFGNTERPEDSLATLADTTYTETYNLKTQATAVMNHYRTEVGYVNMSNDEYNSILWIIDNMYLPEHKDAAEMKAKILEKAGIVGSVLTDDDIEFVQQMALWYYSNYDENGGQNSLSLKKEYELMDKTEINGEALDEIKASQINILYHYFVENAILYATNYGAGDTRDILPTKPEFTVNSSSKTVTTDNGYSVIGPFSITKTDGEVGYELEIQVKDKNGKIIPEKIDTTPIIYVVKNPTDMTTDIASIEQAIGTGEFYLKISNRLASEYDLTDANIEAICTYEKMYKTTATLWLATNEDQPVIKVEKEEIKEFDLALRKYITKVNGNPIANSKEPVIDTTKLANDTTAEYAHRKDPVEVETGDNVTYKISVYNEGELHGIVTEIIDYLPEGLEFDIAKNPDFIAYKDTYTEAEKAGKKYAYIYNNATRELRVLPLGAEYLFELDPFEGTTLDTESIEIVCTVTATVGTADKVLTNIATMKYVPSNATVEDRDSSSEPSKLNLPLNTTDWENYRGDVNNKPYLGDSTYYYEGQEDDDDFDKVVIKGVPFDLALRKYITKVNGSEITTKIPQVDTSKLETVDETTGKTITTAEYKHRKDPIEVKTGDNVTYTISVYNEGKLPGIVTEIIDYLPEGLEFDIAKNPDFIAYKDTYTEAEKAGKKYAYIYNTTTRELRILPLEAEYLFELEPFEGTTLDTESLEIVCTVTATISTTDKVLTNIATMKYEASNDTVEDRDSSSNPSNLNIPTNPTDWENYSGDVNNKPYLGDNNYFYKGQEDDDDFDKVVIKGVPFDLALRKFITKVNGADITSRVPQIDTSKLNIADETTGRTITTAKYTHSKEPVIVKQGDLVTFTIRVYNEGELDGYAMEIADYIPEGLGYLLNYKENTDNGWSAVADGTNRTIDLVGTEGLYTSESVIKNLEVEDFYSTSSLSDVKILTGKAKIVSTALDDELIKAYDPELVKSDVEAADDWQQSTSGTDGLYYRDVEITCIVLAENTYKGTLRNIAEVEEDKAVDHAGNEISVSDRDSTPENVDIANYNPPADNSTYQEDDDDYELLELKYFDLALRKFITAVNNDAVTTRIPVPTINSEGNLEYVHDKTPVYVANSDLVTYTIRVYNEGTVLGYAMEVADDIPDGLVFLPEHELNKQYGWVMYDVNGEKTEDPLKAIEIRTKHLENSLLKPYDATKAISNTEPLNPDYADVKVVFQVIEEDITQTDRIIINKAQITEDKAVDEEGNELDLDDEDSIPDEWNEGEDDQDIEKIYVKKFDLALLKWVTQTIVTVDGKTTTTDTGFTPYDDPEPIAKVIIDKKKLNKTTVKFVYNIIVMNQGEIAGYATEITDYIPEGLEFFEEDNPIWTRDGGNKITTRALEGTLLQPGESATIQVVFRWKQDAENLGLKTNIAEISEDYNDKGSKDIDSDPDNVEPDNYDKQQEDDDDKALVILELKTGGGASYIWLGLTVLLIIAGGIILIQKFVM